MSRADDPPSFPYQTRVTIDVDSYVRSPRIRVLRAYTGLYRAGAGEVLVAVSSGGLGYHVEGRFRERLDELQVDRIRRNLCDDANRSYMDAERGDYGHTTDVFWGEKGGNDGERQVFETPADAFEYVSRTRTTDSRRARALQLFGRRAVTDRVIPRPSDVEGSE